MPTSGGGWDWSAIRQTNYFFSNLGKFTLDDKAKAVIGEVKYFRAMFYFQKLVRFGDVPWINKPLDNTSPESFAARDSRSVVADSILADLDYAIENLKWKDATERGRLTKEAAYALKSRVALFEGTWEKYHAGTVFGVDGSNGKKFLKIAAATSLELINAKKASVYTSGKPEIDYWNLFNRYDYSFNPEVLLWREYNQEKGIVHFINRAIPHNGAGLGLTKSLVDDYLCTDGQPIQGNALYSGDGNYADFAKNRDPRLAQTVCNIGDPRLIVLNGDTARHEYPALAKPNNSEKNITGFQIYKGGSLDYATTSASGSTMGSIIFRYAEVLLNYAEAKAELGELTQADVDMTIKPLRDRVGMPNFVISAIESATYATKAFPIFLTC